MEKKKMCYNCGAPVMKGSTFCSSCGAPIRDDAVPENNAAGGNAQIPKEFIPQRGGRRHKSPLPIILAAIAILAVVGVIAFVLLTARSTNSKTVNLEACIQHVEFEGNSSEGRIVEEPAWDEEALRYYLEKVLDSEENDLSEVIREIEENFTLTADKTNQLSNGDTVKIQIGYHNKEILEDKYGVHFTGSAIEELVKSLVNMREADPLDGLRPTFHGISPVASVEIDTEALDRSAIEREILTWLREGDSSYTITRNGEGISNNTVAVGDELEIIFNDTGVQRWYERGYTPSRTSMTYTVTSDDVAAYIPKYEELTEETVQAVTTKFDDLITTYLYNNYSEEQHEFVGKFYLVPKDECWTEDMSPVIRYIYHVHDAVQDGKHLPDFYVTVRMYGITIPKTRKEQTESDVNETASDKSGAGSDESAGSSGQRINYDTISDIEGYYSINDLYDEKVTRFKDSWFVEYEDESIGEMMKQEQDLAEIDPFAGIKPGFWGSSPVATAYLDENSINQSEISEDMLSWITQYFNDMYTVTKRDGSSTENSVKIGDQIKISLTESGADLYRRFGYAPTRTEMLYDVTEEDLRSYITRFEDLSEESRQTIEKRINDTIDAFVTNHYGGQEWKMVNRIFVTPKKDVGWNAERPSRLWYIFKVITPANENEEEKEDFYALNNNYLVYGRINEQGEKFEGEQIIGQDNYSDISYYNSYDEFYNNQIKSTLDYYDVEYEGLDNTETAETEETESEESK